MTTESPEEIFDRGGTSETFGPGAKTNAEAAEGDALAKDPKLFTVKHWIERDLPDPDYLLGTLLSTTTRMLLIGPTGIGKTNFSLALAFAAASGTALLHWASRWPGRVLYIDGEMSARLARDRLRQAVKRHGTAPDNLIVVNREDFPGLSPLNEEAGQKFVDWLIEEAGGADLLVLDNIQALLVGSLKDDDTWAPVLPWIRDLTKRKIGQIWVHHTGHDTAKGYGDKSREWQFDTVALMKSPDSPSPDRLLEFRLEFPKARERGPENRKDFDPADIWIDADDCWRSMSNQARTSKPPSPKAKHFYSNLSDLLAREGKRDLPFRGAPPAVTRQRWREHLIMRGEIDRETRDNAQRARISKYQSELIDARWIAVDGDYIWSLRLLAAEA
jgi:hypothetical protein